MPEYTHEECKDDEMVWLPVFAKDHAPTTRHRFCKETGIVRNQGPEVARKTGFYINILSDLQEYLDQEARRLGPITRLTQTQIRLIAKDLEDLEGFEDKYWRTESSQVRDFIDVVRYYRKDLPPRLLLDFVTRQW